MSGIGDSILGNSLFEYCHNNPVKMSDNNGNWPEWAIKVTAAVAVVAVVAFIAVITVYTAGAGTAAAVIAVGAASSAFRVGQAAKAWDSSSKGGPWSNMSDHYKRHVLQEGKKHMTKSIITYTDDAIALWNKSNGVGKLMPSGSLRLKGFGVGGFYSPSEFIRSFFYQ